MDSSVIDLELPSLNFHQMCWAREDKWGDRTVLVSTNTQPQYCDELLSLLLVVDNKTYYLLLD